MGLPAFVSSLLLDGRPSVADVAGFSEEELQSTEQTLFEFERSWRDELAGRAPPYSSRAARYGAVMLYRACQFLVFRDVDEETVRRELQAGYEGPVSPSEHYSADLTLRFLPDAIRLARARSREDPLGDELVALAHLWPLSSVGVEGVRGTPVDGFVGDPCLLQLYVDRIIAAADTERIQSCHGPDDPVRVACLRTIGAFPDLSPTIATVLGIEAEPAPAEESEE